MSGRALPTPLRHRVADTILAALHDQGTRERLVALGLDKALAREWCGVDAARHYRTVQERARQASTVLRPLPVRARAGSLDEALGAAAVLFDGGLFFEAHEVLEPHWRQAGDNLRRALQGLIQVAVGYQHWADGNLRGAGRCLGAGIAHMKGQRVGGVDLGPFGEEVARTLVHLGGAMPCVPSFPRRADAGRTPGRMA